MYGDPQSSPHQRSPATPSPRTRARRRGSRPGSPATPAATAGSCSCNDTGFPPCPAGSRSRAGSTPRSSGPTRAPTPPAAASDPPCSSRTRPLTLCELATGSAPVAILQLDTDGHLDLITYNGGTGHHPQHLHGLRPADNSWHRSRGHADHHHVDRVCRRGPDRHVSGTATGMTSAWTWLVANGDFGTAGGSHPPSIQHGGNIALLSHWAVYPQVLPAGGVLAHYCAAVDRVRAAPRRRTASRCHRWLTSTPGAAAASRRRVLPRTAAFGGILHGSTPLSAVVAAQVGTYTSGPSSVGGHRPGEPADGNSPCYGVWIGWTGCRSQLRASTPPSTAARDQRRGGGRGRDSVLQRGTGLSDRVREWPGLRPDGSVNPLPGRIVARRHGGARVGTDPRLRAGHHTEPGRRLHRVLPVAGRPGHRRAADRREPPEPHRHRQRARCTSTTRTRTRTAAAPISPVTRWPGNRDGLDRRDDPVRGTSLVLGPAAGLHSITSPRTARTGRHCR